MKYFLICPVRNATEEQRQQMVAWIVQKESAGDTVYYPARDTNQNDSIGYRICRDNRQALAIADKIAIFWDKTSQGSLFDLGMAFALEKPIEIINVDEIEPTESKSFSNMMLMWRNVSDNKYRYIN